MSDQASRAPTKAGEPTNLYLMQIGELTLTWSTIEFHMREAITTLLNVKWPTGEKLFGTRSANTNWAIFSAICLDKVADERIISTLKGLDKEVELLYEFRNEIVHGVWGTEDSGSLIALKKLSIRKNVFLSNISHYIHRTKILLFKVQFIQLAGSVSISAFDSEFKERCILSYITEMSVQVDNLGPLPSARSPVLPKAAR
ncbi:hypothetical protein [Falsiroseomonas sp.]|uniref:hypothetical protein n=1 Tax=Falsiroseomonas sp. TaxID=2870721 RepID=UPI002715FDD6|nr:hypothetical protein [Falsiroseomonas sp.]MDO9500632.1 hypothetical protein [Falsiroseomonas sp.]